MAENDMPKSGVLWLMRAFGWRRGRAVAAAYRARLDPNDTAARLILDDLARYCRAGATSFVAGDPHQTAFNEGARDAFLHIVEMIGLKAADFPLDLPGADIDSGTPRADTSRTGD